MDGIPIKEFVKLPKPFRDQYLKLAAELATMQGMYTNKRICTQCGAGRCILLFAGNGFAPRFCPFIREYGEVVWEAEEFAKVPVVGEAGIDSISIKEEEAVDYCVGWSWEDEEGRHVVPDMLVSDIKKAACDRVRKVFNAPEGGSDTIDLVCKAIMGGKQATDYNPAESPDAENRPGAEGKA